MKPDSSAPPTPRSNACVVPAVLVAALGLACAATLHAQSAPRPATAPAKEDTVTLNPFEVKADSDRSYGALNANSITAFNLPIDRLPVTADILNQKFMPVARENGLGCRSVYSPTNGCRIEAVSWKASVIKPIWLKLKFSSSFKSG